jgi:dUTP pyrophosphatase
MIYVKIKSMSGVIPLYQTDGASGCDICSTENYTLKPGERYLFSTGIYLEVPQGYECQIRPRSGLAFKHGITVLNAPATIDCDYRGEVKVLLINHDHGKAFDVARGDRIAQLIFAKVERANFIIDDNFNKTDRGAGGFGSTGIK